MASAEAGPTEHLNIDVAGSQPRHASELGDLALAGLRVSLCSAALWQGIWERQPWAYGDLGIDRLPILGGSALDALPDSTTAIGTGSAVLAAALVALMLGYRRAGWIALPLTYWILGVSQGINGVNHNHHILWLMAVVVAGRSCSRLSLWPTRRGADPNAAMTLGVAFIGIVYAFPGLAKLAIVERWVGADHLRLTIERYDALYGVTIVPPDGLIPFMAIGALLFELLFVIAVMTRWRQSAIGVAIVFHLCTGLTLGIWFTSLLLALPAFLLPWRLAVPTVRQFFLPIALLAGAVIAGVASEAEGWPVAHYPKFDGALTNTTTRVIAVTEDGTRYPVGPTLLPDGGRKLERQQPISALEAALERKLGEPVTIIREEVPLGDSDSRT